MGVLDLIVSDERCWWFQRVSDFDRRRCTLCTRLRLTFDGRRKREQVLSSVVPKLLTNFEQYEVVVSVVGRENKRYDILFMG